MANEISGKENHKIIMLPRMLIFLTIKLMNNPCVTLI